MPQRLSAGVMELAARLVWQRDGEQFFGAAVASVDDDGLDQPSRLPGWSRKRVIAHVARNADALVNLLTWARTGVETPMYASPEARDDGITTTSALPPGELRADYAAAVQRLAEAVAAQPEAAWEREVRTAQGRMVRAAEVPWMRSREVWIHAVDLATDLGFADVPAPILSAILDDVLSSWARRDVSPDVMFRSGEQTWGTGTSVVSGNLSDLVGWATGRRPLGASSAGPIELPIWL